MIRPRRTILSPTPILMLLLLAAVLVAMPALASEESDSAGTEYIFKWINFFTVFAPAIYFGRKPLKAAFDAMRDEIRSDIVTSQQQKSEAEARIAEVETKLARLGEETERLRTEAKTEMAAQFTRIREGAKQETERIAQISKMEIESSRRAAGIELRAFSARLAVQLAEEKLRKQLTPAIHAKLFKSFVADLAERS